MQSHNFRCFTMCDTFCFEILGSWPPFTANDLGVSRGGMLLWFLALLTGGRWHVPCEIWHKTCHWEKLGSSAGSISPSEHYFMLSHSWAQSYHSEYFPPSSHFRPFLAILRQFKAIHSNSRQFQAIPGYARLFHPIPVYFYVYQPIWTNINLVISGHGSASLKLCV